jgi:hypothetical protein
MILCPSSVVGSEPPSPTAAETRAFMKALLRYVEKHHLKTDPRSEQRGMVYEYFDTTRKGQPDAWVQGEALDTMHDGAWLAAALVMAYRATGDRTYKDFLTRHLLPFYCKMLNHSDTLFSAKRDDSRPKGHRFDREHALQEGEKGFVPYWWDDGASVSLERRRERNPLGPFSCTDRLVGKPNPDYRLDGWSHGSSNHLAQDLGVMIQLTWLLLADSDDREDKTLRDEVAAAARHLQECRMRHHGHIPMCDAPAALAWKDGALMKHVPDQSGPALWNPDNHVWRALVAFKPGQRYPSPGFADDQHYRYHFGVARHGGKVPDALAFHLIFDALTEPLFYRAYCDDEVPDPGINRFDLHPLYVRDGKPEDYRSDRKGPGKGPRPIGSRLGPQNMVCCGWGLQLLAERPGIWELRHVRDFPRDVRVPIDDPVPDGKADPPAPAELDVNGVKLRLLSTRTELRLEGQSKGDVTVEVFGQPDAKGPHARLILSGSKEIKLVNDSGQSLIGRASVGGTTPLRFRIALPYTLVKGQALWANGMEHGRCSVRIGKEVRNFYLLSPVNRVRERLRDELGGGLRTWQTIFREKGYIPTGIGAGSDWDRFSDTGGYAHLIAAGAQWLLVLEGKKDWETHHVPVELPEAK